MSEAEGLTPAVVRWMMTAPDGRELPELSDFMDRPQWMAEASCRDEPPDVFFPVLGGSYRRAREVCDGCSVRADCLSYALDDEDLVGWWGGTSDRERQRMRRAAG